MLVGDWAMPVELPHYRFEAHACRMTGYYALTLKAPLPSTTVGWLPCHTLPHSQPDLLQLVKPCAGIVTTVSVVKNCEASGEGCSGPAAGVKAAKKAAAVLRYGSIPALNRCYGRFWFGPATFWVT